MLVRNDFCAPIINWCQSICFHHSAALLPPSPTGRQWRNGIMLLSCSYWSHPIAVTKFFLSPSTYMEICERLLGGLTAVDYILRDRLMESWQASVQCLFPQPDNIWQRCNNIVGGGVLVKFRIFISMPLTWAQSGRCPRLELYMDLYTKEACYSGGVMNWLARSVDSTAVSTEWQDKVFWRRPTRRT